MDTDTPPLELGGAGGGVLVDGHQFPDPVHDSSEERRIMDAEVGGMFGV